MPRKPKKPRTDVPQTIVDVMMLECDRICCVCRRRPAAQFHHLNEVPTDHDPDNLAVLCFECHDATQTRGGFSRHLNAAQVRLARDEWHATSRRRRESGLPRPELVDSVEFETVLEAVAVVRIRELGLLVRNGAALDPLYAFIDGFGPRVSSEILRVLSDAAITGAPRRDRIEHLCDLVRTLLPIYTLVGPQAHRVRPEERELFVAAQEIGRTVAYGASRRTFDLAILNAGGRVLWSIVRFAQLNNERALLDGAAGTMRELIGWCEGSSFEDGARWLAFLMEDALHPGKFPGVFPADVAAKIG